MKQKKMIFRSIVGAGVFAVLFTGCVKVFSAEHKTKSGETDNWKSISSATRVQEDEVIEEGKNTEEQELISNAKDAFKNYFDLSIDLSQYETKVTYFKALKDKGMEASYLVSIDVPENWKILNNSKNIGPDGFPTKEAKKKLKPGFYASYNEDKKLKSLSVNYMNWKEAKIPLTVEEAKKVAKEFLESKDMLANGEIEFMHAKIIASSRVYLIYKNGEDGAIGISVDIYASKVDDFEYMNKEKAEAISKPMEEGEGLG